jgi:hypothetical protein
VQNVFLPAWNAAVAQWKNTKDEMDKNSANCLEKTTESLLREVLTALNVPASDMPDARMLDAMEAYYGPELGPRQMFPGAVDMLKRLSGPEYGLRLALVTNSADTAKQKRCISMFDLDSHFGTASRNRSPLLACCVVLRTDSVSRACVWRSSSGVIRENRDQRRGWLPKAGLAHFSIGVGRCVVRSAGEG